MSMTITIDITELVTALTAITTAINVIPGKIDNFIFQESEITLTSGDGTSVTCSNVGVPTNNDPGA